jgi:predicted dehydrogenase
MTTVCIYGAGSIGNHLAFACRGKGWEVAMCDTDPAALTRMRDDIYPARYGAWDPGIQLLPGSGVAEAGAYDIVIIGTPPESHLEIALSVLRSRPPRVMVIEKPLCPPDLKGCDDLLAAARATGCRVLVGYNHATCRNTVEAEELLRRGAVGEVLSLSVRWLEHWGGIFSAHPWLAGPRDSYLGFSARGGGACGEHSHGIHLWQHFARVAGKGRITEVSCMMDMVETGGLAYDRISQLNVKTERGLVGSIVQDVITEPAVKTLRITGDRGYVEWYANYEKGQDAVLRGESAGKPALTLIPKARPDDFKGEIDHVASILGGGQGESPLSLESGLDAARVIAAAHLSHSWKRTARIRLDAGYGPESVVPA